MKILFVDDDNRLRESLAEYFRWVEGWEVVAASSAAEAIKALNEPGEKFDVILLDIMMPPDGPIPPAKSGNGFDTGLVLLDMLVAREPRCPVVILSARQDLHFTVQQGKAADYLRKTQLPEEIALSVRAAAHGESTLDLGEGKP